MKIKHKLIFLFSFLAILPFSTISLIGYVNSKSALEKQALNALEAEADAKASDIIHDIQLRQEQAKELAGTILLKQLEPSGVNDPDNIARIQSHIESVQKEVRHWPLLFNRIMAT